MVSSVKFIAMLAIEGAFVFTAVTSHLLYFIFRSLSAIYSTAVLAHTATQNTPIETSCSVAMKVRAFLCVKQWFTLPESLNPNNQKSWRCNCL